MVPRTARKPNFHTLFAQRICHVDTMQCETTMFTWIRIVAIDLMRLKSQVITRFLGKPHFSKHLATRLTVPS
jgi:hypothetical protein